MQSILYFFCGGTGLIARNHMKKWNAAFFTSWNLTLWVFFYLFFVGGQPYQKIIHDCFLMLRIKKLKNMYFHILLLYRSRLFVRQGTKTREPFHISLKIAYQCDVSFLCFLGGSALSKKNTRLLFSTSY